MAKVTNRRNTKAFLIPGHFFNVQQYRDSLEPLLRRDFTANSPNSMAAAAPHATAGHAQLRSSAAAALFGLGVAGARVHQQ